MARRAAYIVLGFVGAAFFLSQEAQAQLDAQPTGPTIGASTLYQPDRVQKSVGADGGVTFVPPATPLRPANLNPYAVNYQDCVADLYLFFDKVTVENFGGHSDSAQVWASLGDQACAQVDSNRNGTVCWPVLPNQDVAPGQPTSFTRTPIRVRDIIAPPSMGTDGGTDVCRSQPSYGHQEFFLYFIPIIGTAADASGVPYKYTLDVDLVGPPGPALLPVGIGDSLLVANWAPNTDSDTAGYDIFIDPFPGQEKGPAPTGACDAGNGYPAPFDAAASGNPSGTGGSATGNACYDPSLQGAIYPLTPPTPDAGASVDASSSDGGDAGDAGGLVDSSSEGGTPDAGADAGGVEGGDDASSVEGGEEASAVEGGDDASDAEVDSTVPVVDSGGATEAASDAAPIELGSGGIANFPSGTMYMLNPSGGMTVTGESVGTYTITGLRNCTPYVFVVSAVDAYGNIGPPSNSDLNASCAAPQAAGDFWQTYRGDGGQGGGYCALETVGRSPHSLAALALLAGGVALAASRRRRAR